MSKIANSEKKRLVLLTGVTGYVGGRLLKILESKNLDIRCLTRRPEALESRVSSQTEVFLGDVTHIDSLERAMAGVDTAYYLVHSMGSDKDFEQQDRQAASTFSQVAKSAGVKRIIYLGGLGNDEEKLSIHLRSRQEVGKILRSSGVQTIEFRASIVIGSGSLSFELIRAITERLPVLITPRWVNVPAQPISIIDLLQYLYDAIDIDFDTSKVFEIGGADRVSYGDLIREYARQRNLKRFIISVPVLTPKLSSMWLGLVTPLYARIGRKLIDSIRSPTVVQDTSASDYFEIKPRRINEAIAEALTNEDQEFAETVWSDALSSAGEQPDWGGVRFGNRIVDTRHISVDVPPQVAFKPIQRIGGQTGWYYANWLWILRGFIDLLVGGVGMRRGRKDAEYLYIGDTLDFWRVEEHIPNRKLRLYAEMKLPGRAWLEFEVSGHDNHSTIYQTAIFDPIGFFGLAYWYLIYPLHKLIFAGMIRKIAESTSQEK